MNVGELKAKLSEFNDAACVVINGDTCYEDGFVEIKKVTQIKVSPTPSSELRSSWMGEYKKDESAFIVACLLGLVKT